MITKEITLDMKEKIEIIRNKYGCQRSSHTFQSIYMWRQDMDLTAYISDDLFAVKCDMRGNNSWFFPCGGDEEKKNFIIEVMKNPKLSFCYATENDISFLKREFPEQFEFIECEGDHEYIYDSTEQKELKGRKFSNLRNHVNKVISNYNVSSEEITSENIDYALSINEDWTRQAENNADLEDATATKELLNNWDKMNAKGIIISIDNIPYSVVAGFPISDNMFDMCLAKQKENVPGLSTYAKQLFINSLSPNYTLINAEEDLNISGLRSMKQQMRPIRLIKMFEIIPR